MREFRFLEEKFISIKKIFNKTYSGTELLKWHSLDQINIFSFFLFILTQFSFILMFIFATCFLSVSHKF